ncbi:MAG: nucleoside phosphorylase [Pseudomonadota bacterium]
MSLRPLVATGTAAWAGIGIICGMAAEATALGVWTDSPDIRIAITGARPEEAEASAKRLLAEGATSLVSWGIAGGLDPDLAPGDLVHGEAVSTPDRARWPLAMPEGGLRRVVLLGSEAVVTTPDLKAALRIDTGAAAVDMETHRVATVAARAGVPCYAVRAIADPWDRALPSLAANALGPDGRPRIAKVIMGLAGRPWELPRLLAAKRDSDRALAALSAAADATFSRLLAVQPPS